MNRPVDTQLPTKTLPKDDTPSTGSLKVRRKTKNWYLIQYNAVSAALWLLVLVRTALSTSQAGDSTTYASTFNYVRWVQTLAALEILHAAVGIVRAPIITTILQVSSRLVLVWIVSNEFVETTAKSPAYATMLIAWSSTEIIRYSYFAIIIAFGSVPDILTWLRYNTFFVLYPLGISSECWLMYKALEPAWTSKRLYFWVIIATLLIYVPGSYTLYTHMISQRKKVMKSLKA